MSNPANEIQEWNKLGKCMEKFASNFEMACGCEKCINKILLSINESSPTRATMGNKEE